MSTKLDTIVWLGQRAAHIDMLEKRMTEEEERDLPGIGIGIDDRIMRCDLRMAYLRRCLLKRQALIGMWETVTRLRAELESAP